MTVSPFIRWFFTFGLVCLLGSTGTRGDSVETNLPIKSLTVQECVQRALDNNLEIKFQRINPTIQSWGVVGAQSIYDPILSGSVNYQDSTTPLDGSQFGTNGPPLLSLKQRSLQSSGTLSGLLPTGAHYDFSTGTSRDSGNTQTNFTFLYTGSAGASLTQPLLKNFGFGVNSASIRIARTSHAIAVQDFINLVMSKINEVSKAYYELVFAIENYKAASDNRELARQLLDQNRQRLQIGTMSRLDVIQAEAGVAESELAVITAARTIKDNENTLKRLICQQVTEFRGDSLLPVNYPVVEQIATDVAQSTRTALEMRADYQSARQALEKQNIQVRFNRNQLWPEVDLQGSYGLNGRGHTFDNYDDNLSSGKSPVWGFGLVVSLPIGDRQARANYHIAKLDAAQALLSLKSLEQDIIVQVDNAVGHVETNLKSVEAAAAASRLADESLKAEKEKLLAGSSTTFLVLQAQSQLTAARSAEIRARADYAESIVALDLAQGTILQKNSVTLDLKR